MTRPSAFWSGWVLFAGVMMLLIGASDVLAGIAAIGSEEYFVRGEDRLLLADFTVWGWMLAGWGVLLCAVGLALLRGGAWARWPAVAIAGLNVLGHAAFMAFPVWNVMVMGLSVVVIFALTVRWEAAQADLEGPA